MPLMWANKGVDIAICGQSNAQGFATGAVSSLPDTDPIDGHTLVKALPGTATLYEDGASVAAYTNPFGPEVGLFSVLSACTVHKRAINGTEISTWGGGAGHMADSVGDWNTQSRKPKVLIWIQGETDAADGTGAKAAAYDAQLTAVMAIAKAQAGAAMGVVAVRIPTTDTTTYPQVEAVRTATRAWCAKANLNGRHHHFFDPTGLDWYSAVTPLQADATHLTGLAMYRLGRAIGLYLQSEGYG